MRNKEDINSQKPKGKYGNNIIATIATTWASEGREQVGY
jgi:hypothetical protein